MSTYKSQHPPPWGLEDRASVTRLPQRAIIPTMTTTITAGTPMPSQVKLQKKIVSQEQQVYSRKPVSHKGLARIASPFRPSTGRTVSPNVQQSSMIQSRPTRQTSTSRLPRLDVPISVQPPSLASSSSASTIESPRSNVLRRKQTSVGVVRRGPRIRDDSMSSQDDTPIIDGIPGGYKDPFSETASGISLPPSSTKLVSLDPRVEIYGNGLYDYNIGPTDILPLPTPQYALSVTPSTRYSESPGGFSTSSTPTSMSSYSPGTSISRTSVRTKQMSPLQSRPPVTRYKTPDESKIRHPHTLSTVRESSVSSSSNSTVTAEAKQKERQLPGGLAALPQSPRISSASIPVKKPPTQAPPEFAHLASDSPVLLPASRRPSRPSRDGTPDIKGLRDPSPIIQSNIISVRPSHRRNSSAESKFSLTTATNSRSNLPSKTLSRFPSPNPYTSLPSGNHPTTRGATPEVSHDREKRRGTEPSSASAPSPSKSSRFGFLSRRVKTEPALSVSKSDNKLQRRGPSAGTGHEGYGRLAVRGRSGSSMSTASIGRSASAGTTVESLNKTPSTRKSSMTSTTSTEMDDFFLTRLAPVVLRGTGSSTELSRSPEPMHSSSSIDLSAHVGQDQKKMPKNTSQKQPETSRPTLLPSAMLDNLRAGSPIRKKKILGQRRPSESDDDTKKSFLPTSVSDRTSRALQSAQGPTGSTASASRATSRVRKNSISNILADGKEGSWLRSSKKNKPEKEQVKPSKRWNFFQRANAAPDAIMPAAAVAIPAPQNAASRSVAHYALMDQSGLDKTDIEQLMQEASTPDEGTETALPHKEAGKNERLHSPLLPPKPMLRHSSALPARSISPQVLLRSVNNTKQRSSGLTIKTDIPPQSTGRCSISDLTPFTDLSQPSSPFRPPSPLEVEQAKPVKTTVSSPQDLPSPGLPPISPPPRPSRLPQVGRIPQVVSSRRQIRCPSAQSFSRPFVATQPRPAAPPRTSFDSIGSYVATAGPAEPYPILQGLNALTHGSAIASISPFDELSRQSEFFKFPPRKDSEVSYSSSSGVWSFAPVASTAVVPESGAPLSDDELWNEYDDLIDEVLLPVTSGTNVDAAEVRSQHPSLEPLPLNTKTTRSSSRSEQSDIEVSNPSLHLRRSRLLAVLHSTQSPDSSVSFSEFLSDYGEQKINVIDPVTGRLSLPTSPSLSTGSNAKRTTRSSLPTSLPPTARQSRATIASRASIDRDSAVASRYRDSRLMEIAETQADGLVSMANLRFGALMTSKWLSFGRVLFSPVHFELKDPNEDRVLVIDGLGKDWSYYCALTYPEATVYNMSSEPSPALSEENSSEPWSTLENHRHICHSTLSMTFPFPMHFFASVVLRFPTALPSSEHHFILSEAKRVLRPGGYLEFSVLDMDLVNMGNRARRAVRELKMRMQVVDEKTSLRNISDEIMAGIGRNGFVECHRCVVGVPVAGKLPHLDDAQSTTTKRKGNTASSGSRTTALTAKPIAPKQELSFSDLLRLSSSSDSTDTGIADMVARVGRWWYSRCYESIVLHNAGEPDVGATRSSGNILANSIWRDNGLIHECETRGTSFKLLIGYAQKPTIGVRRTVSI